MAAQLGAQSELKSVRGNALSLAIPASHKHLADKAYADKLKVALEAATGRKLLLNPLMLEEGRYRFDLDDLERCAAEGGRLLILCSPHNPVGRVWQR